MPNIAEKRRVQFGPGAWRNAEEETPWPARLPRRSDAAGPGHRSCGVPPGPQAERVKGLGSRSATQNVPCRFSEGQRGQSTSFKETTCLEGLGFQEVLQKVLVFE